jgi:ATP-dependent DNA ligase
MDIRLRLERDGDRVRLITRGGYYCTDRYPGIVEARAQGPAEAVRARW